MKSFKQLKEGYYIRKKSPSYWAGIVNPSRENCLKNYDCNLPQELNRINEELARVARAWGIPKHVAICLPDYFDCNDIHKVMENKKRHCEKEECRIARDLFREKAAIEDKITSCLNSKTYLAIRKDYNIFSDQASWNIA